MRIATTLGAGLLLLLPAAQALAHAQLVKADPAVGSTVAGGPTRIWLRFNEFIRVPPSAVRLTWPDGHKAVIKALAHDPKDKTAVIAPLQAPLGPGRYGLEWRALSGDGHSTQGQFSFTVRP
jgi:methionine-rich copper-binding protein CopC